jgi:peptidoglycan hydrolase-like protein with peptidoglycan-binding domain
MRRFLSPLARPTGLLGTGFVAISAAIVANALFLQSGRHPAPLFTTRFEFAAPERLQPDAVVEAVQAALKSAGYYAGPVDGIAGMQTASAIRAFEQRNGMKEIGRATPDLLEAIRSTPSGFRPPTAAAPAEPAPAVAAHAAPDERVAAVQAALSRAAYGQVKADGVFGPQTREAIVRFQEDHGLPPTGEISDALVVELRAAGALESE